MQPVAEEVAGCTTHWASALMPMKTGGGGVDGHWMAAVSDASVACEGGKRSERKRRVRVSDEQ